MNCPALIKLRPSADGTKLVVTEMSEEHNHEVNKKSFEHLPTQRRVEGETKEDVKRMLEMKANKKLIQQHILHSTGKSMTLKDIHNMVERKDGNLTELIEDMKSQPGGKVELYVDEEKNFKGLFYQDEEMRWIFDAFPEILLIDATYKLNNLRLPLYVMLAVDGNGESEIVGLMLLADEQADTIRKMIRLFKKHNAAWEKINCVMADKDMTERKVIKEEIQQAGLLICLFHTMRSFKREITTEKMGISVDERLQVLEIIQSMAYAPTEEVYQDLYAQLMDTRFSAVKVYFIENWHSIRDEWVEGNKKKFSNFLNSTNNHLESINQKLKSVITKHSCLLDFHRDLQHCIASLRQERDHRAAMIFQKRPVDLNEFESNERLFYEQCTPYAFSQVRKQLSLVPKVGKFTEQPCGVHTVTTSTVDVVKEVKLPPKMKVRGRPKGADMTAIGLPKRRKLNSKRPTLFINKSPTDKAEFILGMVTSQKVISKALSDDYLIEACDIFQLEKIPKKIVDEIVNVYRVKKYFSTDGWNTMSHLLEKIANEVGWHCKTCLRELNEKQEQIGCDVCLEWFHLTCTGKSVPPKTKSWICRSCCRDYENT
ncbi:zinc finger SWIM domain-containing 3-like [Paramuricea clavata]|uniref:Zinc finger SWIM domain-containing 3-like n=1 Tax=Paramuricea clavata TaxID=317549 RepID=A0A7D9HKM5_PARCT|nr:zinc finger SWIM domain-containing 3-like [Paramuricea clavata]